jgi:hypothetical protein
MGITVMVGADEADGYRVLDFMLPSWLHGEVIRFAGGYGDAKVLEPLEYLNWSAYEETALPYRCPSRDELLVAVAHVVTVLTEHGAEFVPADAQWAPEAVLHWYRLLHADLLTVEGTAKMHVNAS